MTKRGFAYYAIGRGISGAEAAPAAEPGNGAKSPATATS